MKKFFKTITALILLPVALSAVETYAIYMWRFAVSSFKVYWSFWVGIILAPFFALRFFKGISSRIYVAEHEMTHALFAVLSGARVKKISIKKDNGAVVVDKANTLITLAPYFFPLLAITIFVVWVVLFHFVIKNPSTLSQYWHWLVYFLIGSFLSFHFFMTSRAVLDGQSDIKRDGVIYSFTVVFILYVLLSAFFMKFMFGPSSGFNAVGRFLSDIWYNSAKIYSAIWRFLRFEVWPEIKRI